MAVCYGVKNYSPGTNGQTRLNSRSRIATRNRWKYNLQIPNMIHLMSHIRKLLMEAIAKLWYGQRHMQHLHPSWQLANDCSKNIFAVLSMYLQSCPLTSKHWAVSSWSPFNSWLPYITSPLFTTCSFLITTCFSAVDDCNCRCKLCSHTKCLFWIKCLFTWDSTRGDYTFSDMQNPVAL